MSKTSKVLPNELTTFLHKLFKKALKVLKTMKRNINILWYIFTYLVRCGFRYLFVVFFLFLFIFFLSIYFCIKGHVHTHINKLLSRRQNVTLNLQYDGLLVMMSRYVSPRNLVKLSQLALMPFYLQRPQTQNY